jgi:DNA-binding NarL/FixJ family response regulator
MLTADLESVSGRSSAPYGLVMRARIVLLAADGLAYCVIAARLGICEDTASVSWPGASRAVR